MRVLTVNAGSSSMKLALIDEHECTIDSRELDAPAARVDPDALRQALDSQLGDADAVGHRIVHGGVHCREHLRVDTRDGISTSSRWFSATRLRHRLQASRYSGMGWPGDSRRVESGWKDPGLEFY